MTTDSFPNRVKLRRVRIVIFKQSLWHAQAYKQGPEKFSAKFLVPKGDKAQVAALDVAIKAAAAQGRWAAKATKVLPAIKTNPMRYPIVDGDTKEWDGAAGHWILSAGNQRRVPVFDLTNGNAPVTQEDGIVYGGCYVNTSVEFYAYDNSGEGIGAGLRGVWFVEKGDAFGGGGSVATDDEFDAEGAGADLMG